MWAYMPCRRTNWQVPTNITKDAAGFDNPEDFFDMAPAHAPAAAAAVTAAAAQHTAVSGVAADILHATSAVDDDAHLPRKRIDFNASSPEERGAPAGGFTSRVTSSAAGAAGSTTRATSAGVAASYHPPFAGIPEASAFDSSGLGGGGADDADFGAGDYAAEMAEPSDVEDERRHVRGAARGRVGARDSVKLPADAQKLR
ncbi:MAG: hypothetical protein EOO41_00880, partial [Methanobacteriota archaeon]